MEKLKEIWEELPAERKRLLSVGAGVTALVLLIWAFVAGGEEGALVMQQSARQEEKSITPLVADDLNGLSVERLKADNERMASTVKTLQKELENLKQQMESKDATSQATPVADRLTPEEVQRLIEDAIAKHDARKAVSGGEEDTTVKEGEAKPNEPKSVDDSESKKVGDTAVIRSREENPFERTYYDAPTARPVQAGAQPGAGQPTPAGAPAGQHARKLQIRHVEPDSKVVASVTGEQKKAPYLPMGSMVTGILITGMDAGTGKLAQKNPYPALIRVKKEAILPNRYRQDVRECFILAAGYGELSSERVHIRSEGVSCVTKKGKPLEIRIKMFAVGEDGKLGLRGRLVSKQGQLLAKSLTAGMLSGFASVFNQQAVPTVSLTPGNTTPFQSVLNKNSLQSGLVKGTSSALDRLAQFYIDQANEIFPVLEIDAGRRVTFVVEHGAALQAKEG